MEARPDAVSIRVEDHLELIHELIESRGEARVSDIADHLSVARPTVTKMLQRMAGEGWVHYERYRPVSLTKKGEAHARWMRKRHGVLVRFLKAIGVSEEVAHLETEGIEHHLSAETIERLQRLAEFEEANPGIMYSLIG
tara:strand:+ start:465 stop:881 length:417 start_codon:yes stop_codon:yes gene_type:complete